MATALEVIAGRYHAGALDQRVLLWSDVRLRGQFQPMDFTLAWNTILTAGVGKAGGWHNGSDRNEASPLHDYDFWLIEQDLEAIAYHATVAEWVAFQAGRRMQAPPAAGASPAAVPVPPSSAPPDTAPAAKHPETEPAGRSTNPHRGATDRVEIASTAVTIDALVDELQRLAQAGATDIAELLRRAKVIATKLRRNDARAWIEHELTGYPPETQLPRYRTIPSELRVRNPVHGWNAVAWEGSNELQEHFATADIRFSIAELAEIASGTGDPHSNLDQTEMDVLAPLSSTFSRLPSARFYSRACFVAILDAVRNRILDWALDLEQASQQAQPEVIARKDQRMTRARPTMFIGSTVEALKVARAVQAELDHDLEITLWNQNVFEPGNATWIDLVSQARSDKYDLALFVLGAEDQVTSRGEISNAPRDNVLLELGLFAGAIGPDRTFFLIDRDNKPKLASDLAGITALVYGSKRSDGNMQSAVGPACQKIRDRAERLKAGPG